MIKDIYLVMASPVMLTVIKKLMDYCNYMTPEEVAIRMIGLDTIDNSGVDLKRFNDILSIKGKKRSVERRDKRVEKRNHQRKLQKLWQRDCKEINRTW